MKQFRSLNAPIREPFRNVVNVNRPPLQTRRNQLAVRAATSRLSLLSSIPRRTLLSNQPSAKGHSSYGDKVICSPRIAQRRALKAEIKAQSKSKQHLKPSSMCADKPVQREPSTPGVLLKTKRPFSVLQASKNSDTKTAASSDLGHLEPTRKR